MANRLSNALKWNTWVGRHNKNGVALLQPFDPPATGEAPLDNIRIVERASNPRCRSEFARLFDAVNISTNARTPINCKSWRCEKCREKWGRRWSVILGDQLKRTPCDLLLNLTTAQMIDHTQLEAALRWFILRFRLHFGPTEYVKVVEYNKLKTQPHFHLLLISPGLVIPPMPEKWDKDLSWPPSIFDMVKFFWHEALCFAAPTARETSVVWLQPPQNGGAAATYAVGYITGKSQKNRDKDEEPDSTWRGRKLSVSRGFFDTTAQAIWQNKLIEWFGPPDREAICYWTPKIDIEPTDLAQAEKYRTMPIMVARYAIAEYYRRWGVYPRATTEQPPGLSPVGYDIDETAEE